MTQSLPQSQKIGLLVRVWSVCGPNRIRLSCFAWVPRVVDAGVPDVVVAPPATRRRLTGKRNLQTFCLWSLLPEEVADAHKSVCLVTLAHPTNSHSAEGIQFPFPLSSLLPPSFLLSPLSLSLRPSLSPSLPPPSLCVLPPSPLPADPSQSPSLLPSLSPPSLPLSFPLAFSPSSLPLSLPPFALPFLFCIVYPQQCVTQRPSRSYC